MMTLTELLEVEPAFLEQNAAWIARVEAAPCGCPLCSRGVSEGHTQCSDVPDTLLALEQAGHISRAYDNGAWHWFVASLEERLRR